MSRRERGHAIHTSNAAADSAEEQLIFPSGPLWERKKQSLVVHALETLHRVCACVCLSVALSPFHLLLTSIHWSVSVCLTGSLHFHLQFSHRSHNLSPPIAVEETTNRGSELWQSVAEQWQVAELLLKHSRLRSGAILLHHDHRRELVSELGVARVWSLSPNLQNESL